LENLLSEHRSQEFIEKLAQLHTTFSQQLSNRIEILEQQYVLLQERSDNISALRQLRLDAHSLAGSAGTFSYHKLGDKARDLELLVSPLLNENNKLNADLLQSIGTLLHELNTLANKGPEKKNTQQQNFEITNQSVLTKKTNLPEIFLVENDTSLANEIVLYLEKFEYTVRIFKNISQVEVEATQHLPAAIIVDLEFLKKNTSTLELSKQLNKFQYPTVPKIFISQRTDWQTRLASIRAGGMAYLTKPINKEEIVKQLNKLSDDNPEEPYRILIVEDVDVLAQHYALVLRNKGIEVTTVNSPAFLLEVLESSQPELILMDLYMPECNGLEAAKIIRQINTYISVPIIFLSTEKSLDQQLQAMQIGGDDFLSKPIRDEHLLSAVLSRVIRFRQLRALMQ